MPTPPPAKGLRWALLLVFILVPLINYLSVYLPGGQRQFADDPETLIDAAGYAFSIWGLIFLGMLLFSIHLLRQTDQGSDDLRRATIYLLLAGLASILFVPASLSGNNLITWVDILAHLVPLILANRALRAHVAAAPHRGHWSYFGPSMYLGWISAAFVISTALALEQLGVDLPSEVGLLLAGLLIITLLEIGLRLLRRKDAVYAATVAWALIAIGVEQGDYLVTRTLAWIGAGVLLAFIILRVSKRERLFYAYPEE